MDLALVREAEEPGPSAAQRAKGPVRRTVVSVIVPTRDRPDFLREALTSIRALEASDLEFEILVGDNGADPRTRLVAEELGAVHIPVMRSGAAAARNAGLSVARGAYIAFLDDDDVWTAEHIRGHLAHLDANPNIEAVFAQVISTDIELRPLEIWPSKGSSGDRLVKEMLSGYYPQIGATLVRASATEAVGLFDESLVGDQDWDWQLRLARRRRVGFVEIPAVKFRQRPAGSHDALRLRRLGYGRRVFFRHALPEYRLWPGPRAFVGAYRGALWQYYHYFSHAALERAQNGAPRGETLRAVWGALRTFPLRTLRDLISQSPVRRAIFGRE